MKSIILLLFLMSFASVTSCAQKYKHKSEAGIAGMTPAQRVDEYANEQAYHKYDVSDDNSQLIGKYLLLDGLKALPRIVEIINDYDPIRSSGKSENKGERFDAMWMLLSDLDNHVIRLRGSQEGIRAMDALERAIGRMRAAGYGQLDQHEWAQHGRFESALVTLESAKGAGNVVDEAIRDTFWVRHKVQMSDKELLEFSNFLVANDPAYPSWSETELIKDYSRLTKAGLPFQIYVMKKLERFSKAYTAFKMAKS